MVKVKQKLFMLLLCASAKCVCSTGLYVGCDAIDCALHTNILRRHEYAYFANNKCELFFENQLDSVMHSKRMSIKLLATAHSTAFSPFMHVNFSIKQSHPCASSKISQFMQLIFATSFPLFPIHTAWQRASLW